MFGGRRLKTSLKESTRRATEDAKVSDGGPTETGLLIFARMRRTTQQASAVISAAAGFCTRSPASPCPDPGPAPNLSFNEVFDVRRRRTPTQARARRPPTSRPPHPPAAGA